MNSNLERSSRTSCISVMAVITVLGGACQGRSELTTDRGVSARSELAAPELPAQAVISARQAGPVEMIRLLLRWDTAGRRFESEYAEALGPMFCYMPDQDCLSPEPGWDMVQLVRGFTVRPVNAEPDNATVEVSLQHYGSVSAGRVLDGAGSSSHTFSLTKRSGLWQIARIAPSLPPQLSLNTALRYATTAVDSARIRAWLALR